MQTRTRVLTEFDLTHAIAALEYCDDVIRIFNWEMGSAINEKRQGWPDIQESLAGVFEQTSSRSRRRVNLNTIDGTRAPVSATTLSPFYQLHIYLNRNQMLLIGRRRGACRPDLHRVGQQCNRNCTRGVQRRRLVNSSPACA